MSFKDFKSLSEPDSGDGRDCLCLRILGATKQRTFPHYNKSGSTGEDVTAFLTASREKVDYSQTQP